MEGSGEADRTGPRLVVVWAFATSVHQNCVCNDQGKTGQATSQRVYRSEKLPVFDFAFGLQSASRVR